MDRILALRNSYFVLRHGHSLANHQRLIVSSPKVGLKEYGLSPEGILEVRSSLQTRPSKLGEVSRIFASDFLRTRQTAEIASEILAVPMEFSDKLRERGFGDWDGTTSANYSRVWERDVEDDTHQDWNVESVRSVATRTTDLVMEIERVGAGRTYLLVSHGDPLQILIAAVSGIDLRRHRQIEPLRTARWRRLGL